MIGKTNAQVIGDSTKYETAVINLTSNQRSATALNGLTVTVTYDNITEEYTWDGNAISLDIPEGSTYTVSSSALTNYTSPSAVEYTAEADNVRYINLAYSTYALQLHYENYLIGIDVTVTCGDFKQVVYIESTRPTPNMVYIPYVENATITVEFEAVSGYITPDILQLTMDSSGGYVVWYYEQLTEESSSYWVIFDDSTSTTTLEVGGNVTVRDNIRAKFKRCVAHPNDDGSASIAYLSDTDSTVFPDGTTPSNTDYMMVHFPKYYYRCEDLGNSQHKLYIAETQITSDYKEERECLIGVFEAYNDSSVLKSKPGVVSSGSITITDFYTYAQANGANWGIIDYRAHKTIANMFCIMYGNTDISTSNSSIPCSGGTKVYNSGNTGDTLSLGNSDGLVNKSSSFLGLEDCYYGKYEFVQGINIIADRKWVVYDGGLKVDTDTAELQSAGYTNIREIGTAPTSSGWITVIKHGEYADVMPTAVEGSDTTHYADYYSQNTGNRIFLRSGSSGNESYCGVFCSGAFRTSSYLLMNFGSRLGFYGKIVVKTKDEFLALEPGFNG